MWRAFARSGLAGLLLSGCGGRTLDLVLRFDPGSCMLDVPAGGSVQFDLPLGGEDGGQRSQCRSCLPVTAPLSGETATLQFLRARTPSCPGVPPGAAMQVLLTAWPSGDCPAEATPLFSARSAPFTAPDGRSDSQAQITLACLP